MTVRPDHIPEDAVAIFTLFGGDNWLEQLRLGAIAFFVLVLIVALILVAVSRSISR